MTALQSFLALTPEQRKAELERREAASRIRTPSGNCSGRRVMFAGKAADRVEQVADALDRQQSNDARFGPVPA